MRLSYILIFLLITASFPLIAGWIPFFQKMWIVLFFLFFTFFVSVKQIYKFKSVVYLLIYFVVLFINVQTGDTLIPSIPIALVEVFFLYLPCAITLWCLNNQDKSFMKKVLFSSFFMYLIECICSFLIIKTQPGIIRFLYSFADNEGGRGFMYSYYRLGLLDYSMAHAIPILIPPLFYAYKKQLGTVKYFIAFCIGMCVFLCWLSDSTTALMIVILVFFLSGVTDMTGLLSNVKKISVVLLLTTPVILSDEIQLKILDSAEKILGTESVFAEKIDEFRYSINNEDMTGDMQGRVDRYNKSICYFVENPIMGTNEKPGNHAAILDRLAVLGLIGFIPLVLYFVSIIKEYALFLPKESLPFYIEGLFAGFLMLTTKGMWVWPMFFVMFMLLPFILFFVDKKEIAQC